MAATHGLAAILRDEVRIYGKSGRETRYSVVRTAALSAGRTRNRVTQAKQSIHAPVAPRRPHEFTTHGITVVDDYAWLKDENWQEVLRDPSILNGDIRKYLEAEND